jgi:signal transduction histidine kinase
MLIPTNQEIPMIHHMFHQTTRETIPETSHRALGTPSETSEHSAVDWQSPDRFLAMLGHELQTPLTAILLTAASELMRAGGDTRRRAAAERVLSSARRMKRITEDLLDFARARRVGGLPVHPTRVDLAELAAGAAREVEDCDPGVHVRVEALGDVRGEWDSGRMMQVLVNLMQNAVQHGECGPPVDVRLVRQPDAVQIEVVNHGEPIPESEVPGLFEPFARGPSSCCRRVSVGLGLYIVSEIVAAHGGEVAAFNSPEAGTVTFGVWLPLRSAVRE